MGIIKTARLIYEYIRRDEEEKIEEVKRAIDGVDLDIEKGSFVAVLGHNGSGKSTFAKHIPDVFFIFGIHLTHPYSTFCWKEKTIDVLCKSRFSGTIMS